MSKQVDERVVSMQFDNKEFESNVKTSMSTIDKLKEKLNFKGASKGMENLVTTTRQFTKQSQSEFESYKSGIFSIGDAWRKMWSSLEYDVAHKMKNLLTDFTITPVKTGFNEFELKMGSIQTIMASTGESLETVNKYLEELNKYSDDTIYSFQDMTSNIGKFTNAGVKLDDAVKAIKGISNEAALSGANANEASRAMYNFSQALSAGYVKLIDWKSIENANMATVGFKEELIKTAVAVGTLTDAGNGMYETLDGTVINATKNFNDSLQDQWMTSEVLITTLGKYADETTDIGAKATAAATEVKTFSMMMDTLKESAQSGWAQTWELLVGNFEDGKKIWTDLSEVIGGFIDKFNDLRNSLIKSAFGKTLTGISDGVGNILEMTGKVTEPIKETVEAVADLGDIVDKVINGDFGNGRERFAKLTEAGWNYYTVQNKVNETLGDSHRYTQKEIDDQEKLLGNVKKTTEATEEQKKETVKLTDEQKKHIKSLMLMSDEQLKNAGYTEDQINAIGNLKKQISDLGVPLDETDARFNNLIDNLDNLNGRFLWIESLKNIGRSLLEVFKTIGAAWQEIFPSTAESRAQGLFNFLVSFYKTTNNILNGIKNNSEELTRIFKGVFAVIDIFATLFGSTFKLVFDGINAVLSGFGTDILSVMAWLADGIVLVRDWIDAHNPIVWLFKKLGEIMKKAADAWRNWIDGLKGSKNLAKDILVGIGKGLLGGVKTLGGLIIDALKALGNTILNDARKILGDNVVDGFIEGIKNGWRKVIDTITGFINKVVETVKDLLGIHSPSLVFMMIGSYMMLGLMAGVIAQWENVTKVFTGIIDFIKTLFTDPKSIDWKKVGTTVINGIVGGVKFIFSAIGNAFKWLIDLVTALFTNIHIWDVLNNVWDWMVDSWNKLTKTDFISKTFKNIGKAIKTAWGWITEKFGQGFGGLIKAWNAIKAWFQEQTDKGLWDTILSVLLGGSTVVFLNKLSNFIGAITSPLEAIGDAIEYLNQFAKDLSKFPKKLNKVMGSLSFNLKADAILKLAGAIAILAGTVILLGYAFTKIDHKKMWEGVGMVAALIGAISVLVIAMTAFDKKGININTTAVSLSGIAIAIVAFAGAIAILASLDESGMKRAAIAVGVFMGLLIVMLGVMTKMDETVSRVSSSDKKMKKGSTDIKRSSKSIGKIAAMLIALGTSMLMMASAMKTISRIDSDGFKKGIGTIIAVMISIIAMSALVAFGKHDFTKLGSVFLGVAAVLLSAAWVMKIMSAMKYEDMGQGALLIAGIFGLITGMIALLQKAKGTLSKNLSLMTGVLISIATVLLSAAWAMKIIGSMEPEAFKQGIIAVGGIIILLGLIALMLKSSKTSMSKHMWSIALIFSALGFALLSIAATIAILGILNRDAIVRGSLAIGGIIILLGLIALIAKSAKISGAKSIGKVAGVFIGLGFALLSIATAIAILSLLKPDKMWSAVGAIAVLIGMLALATRATRDVGDARNTFIGMAVAIAAMALAVAALSFINPEKLIAPVIAMSILMGVFAIVIKTARGLEKGLGILIVLAVVIVAIAAALAVLSRMDHKGMLAGAIGISLVLLAMAGIIAIIKNIKVDLKAMSNVLISMGILTVIIGLMAGVLLLTSGLDPVQALAMIGVLTLFAAMVTALLVVITNININAANMLLGIAGLALITVVIGLMIGVLWAASGLDPAQALAMTGVLTLFAAMIATLLVVINTVNINAANMLLGIAGLALVAAIVAAMAAILVMTKDVDPGQAALMATVLTVFVAAMIAIGIALGAAVGLLASGVAGAGLLVAIIAIIFGGITATILGCSYMLPLIGENLSKFTDEIQGFVDSVKNIDSSVLDGVTNLVAAILALTAASLISGLTNFVDKVKSWFGGKSSLETTLEKFAKAIVNFSKQIKGKIDVSSVNAAAKAFESISKIQDIDTSKIDSTVKSIKKIHDLAIEFSNANYEGLKEFGAALETVAKDGITKFTEAFDNSYDKVLTSVNGMISNTATKVKTEENKNKFVSIGEYFVSGFAQGIINKKAEAAGNAAAVASAAMTAMKAELDEHSPSKETYKIGDFAGQGFVNAFIDYAAVAFSAGSDLAKSASDGLTEALSQVQDVVNSDMDVQPTIRPVLDLSDVRAGVGQMNGLLDTNTSIGVDANISSIRRAMQNNQNGTTNDDVVAAIEGLGSKIDGASGDTYIIEGITYDDGSNIADAVGSIVRAAKIERRI